jgi:hypothetical protein
MMNVLAWQSESERESKLVGDADVFSEDPVSAPKIPLLNR